MTDTPNWPPEATPQRRPEVFRTVRGSALSGTRDRPVRHYDALEGRADARVEKITPPPLRIAGQCPVRRAADADTAARIDADPEHVFEAYRYTEPDD